MRSPFIAGLVVAATALLLGACGDEGEGLSTAPTPSPGSTPTAPADQPTAMESSPTPPTGGAPAAFETIDTGAQSGIRGGQPQLFKIETEPEWEEFWSRHQAIVTPQPALPAVDFSREMVIAVVDRTEPSGGFLLEIAAIEEAEGSLVVRVSKQVPGAGCLVTDALTQPFHIVRLARSDLEPELAIGEETYECG